MITSIYNNSTSVHANERNSLRQWRAAGDAQIGQNRKYRGRSRCAAGPSPAPRFHVTLHARTCLRVCVCTRASKPAVFVGRSGLIFALASSKICASFPPLLYCPTNAASAVEIRVYMLLRVCGIRSVLLLVFCRAFSKEALTAGAQPMKSSTLPDVQNFLDELDSIVHEIVSGKHIQMSTDVEHAVYETTPQVGEPTDDQKGGLAPSTNCSVPSRRSSPDSFENMYDGLENLLEAMGYTVVYKRGVQKMSSLDKAMVAEFQKQTALQINQLDIDNILRYIRTFKDDARLSPHTMASVLAKIANTLARHYDKWEYAIKFCIEAHECFKNTLDESVELKVDQARNLCIGSMCNNNLGWHSAAYGWAQTTQEILCECMAITSEDTEVLKKVAWIQNQCGISYYTYGTEHSKQLGIAYLNTAHSVYKSLQDVESMEKVRANILSTCSKTEN